MCNFSVHHLFAGGVGPVGLIPLPNLKVSCLFSQRLVDKKMATHSGARTSSSSKEMCDVLFCQLPSGEMKGLLLLF